MSIQFITGTAASQHVEALVKSADDWLQQSDSHEVFYLVPNHVKFETEIHVLKELSRLPRYQEWDNMVSMRLQIFSFSRLAWYFLQNTESYQKQSLSSSGKYMILKQVLLEIAEELTLFQYEVNKPGFIEQLVDLFDELQEGFITAEDLLVSIEEVNSLQQHQDDIQKISDLQKIFSAYSKRMEELDCDSHDLLLSLVQFLEQQDMKNIQFIVSGFSNFTAIEKQLIEGLMKSAGEFKISLILDKSYTQQLPEPTSLFFNSGKLYFELYQMAKGNQLPILFDEKVNNASNPLMVQLDEVWQESQVLSPVNHVKPIDIGDALRIWKCDDAYGEITSVAKAIRQAVVEKGVRYQDITVLTRDLPSYQKVLAPVFKENQIPYYLNQEEEMKHHPLVEFINSLFSMKQHYYQYKDVLRFLRTELFAPNNSDVTSSIEWLQFMDSYRQGIDYTENVVLAYGFSGSDWTKKKDWQYIRYHYEEGEDSKDKDVVIQKTSNKIRHLVKDNVSPFFDKLSKVTLGKEACELLYTFMVDTGVEKQMTFMRDQELEKGDLVKARNHEQTWQAFVQLLEEYHDLMGETLFDLDDFVQILKTGLEGLSYSKVPATLDQVEVTSMDLIRAKKSKLTFIIGATDQQLPKKIENKTLLTNEERGILKEVLPFDKFLKKDLTTEAAREPFVFYLSLLSATDQVILTYPKSSDSSKDLKISPYLRMLKNQLKLKEEIKSNGFEVAKNLSVDDFSTDETLLRDWISFKRELMDEKMPEPWLFHQLEKRLLKKLPLKTERLLESLTHQNIPETLTETSVEGLYGETIYASVSKIENFYKCQYKYFLMYGLGLKERDTFELSPAATGDFYHEALDQFFKTIIEGKYSLSHMTELEVRQVATEVLEKVLGQDKFGILNTTNRMNYIKYQLSKTIQRVGWSLKQQSDRSNMSVVQTEVLFGQILQDKGLASLDFQLPGDKQLKVRGKIDRVDKLTVEDDVYLSVIDYKSSKHNFDFTDAYYGLAMQMITYLNVALNNAVTLVGEKAKAAGAFYMQIQNPMIAASDKLTDDKLAEEMLKAFQYEGVLMKDDQLLEILDKTMEPGVKSLVYPYQQLKKETMKSSQFYTEDELDWLLENNQNNFKKAGEKIFNGATELNPAFKKQRRVACEFCPFRSVCQFDVMLKENNYHKIEEVDKSCLLEEREVAEDE